MAAFCWIKGGQDSVMQDRGRRFFRSVRPVVVLCVKKLHIQICQVNQLAVSIEVALIARLLIKVNGYLLLKIVALFHNFTIYPRPAPFPTTCSSLPARPAVMR
jgi:hypothetical protein